MFTICQLYSNLLAWASLDYLGHNISGEGAAVDQAKVADTP